jgi:hypothetical protein
MKQSRQCSKQAGIGPPQSWSALSHTLRGDVKTLCGHSVYDEREEEVFRLVSDPPLSLCARHSVYDEREEEAFRLVSDSPLSLCARHSVYDEREEEAFRLVSDPPLSLCALLVLLLSGMAICYNQHCEPRTHACSRFSNLQLLQFLRDPVSRTDLARVSEGEHEFKTPII